MTPIENLHYAIGELAYAVACADGQVQKEERQKFHDLVEAELRRHDPDFDISGIIFRLMEKDKSDCETTYNWAMNEIKLNSHYLSPELKRTFTRIMEKIAVAFPSVAPKEKELIDRFHKDIALINGDPVFYEHG